MKKAVAHILFLFLLLTTGATTAAVLPHEAIAGSSVQCSSQYKSVAANSQSGSHLSQDITITDWDEYDEGDIYEPTSKAALAVVSTIKGNLLAICHSFQSDKGKIYTSLNFSRLPRHNYISLRVLRI